MKKMKKILIALLAMILCVSMFVSCGGDTTATTGSTETSGTTDATGTTGGSGDNPVAPPAGGDDEGDELPPASIEIIDYYQHSDYQIVYGANAEAWEKAAAYELQLAIKVLTNIEIPVITDFETDTQKRQKKEIVVGSTNRSDEYTVPDKSHYVPNLSAGYVMFVDNYRWVILGGSSAAMYYALEQFVMDQFGQALADFDSDVTKLPPIEEGGDTSIELNYAYYREKALAGGFYPAAGKDISEFSIYYDTLNYMQTRAAYDLRNEIYNATGYLLPIGAVPADVQQTVTKENEDGTTTTEVVTIKPDTYFTFSNSTYSQGKYKVALTTSNNIITLTANNYQGYLGAIQTLSTPNAHGYVDLSAAIESDYSKIAADDEFAARYTYDTKAFRVMFYNVMSDVGADSSVMERNYMQYQMVQNYMPDVLGLQSLDITKREGLNGTNGNYNLITLLESLGYASSFDESGLFHSRQEDDYNVKIANRKYSYYNHTPIFYNTETVKLVASDYLEFTSKETTAPPAFCGIPALTSGKIGATQSATWAILESIEHECYYMVVSANFAENDEAIRAAQAELLLTKIAEVLASNEDYEGIPVFLGGDFAEGKGDKGYDAITSEEGGFTSVQDGGIVENYCSKLNPEITAPYFDRTIGVNQTNAKVNTLENGESSGCQIFVSNLKKSSICNVFGVVADDYTMSASDHLPIFIDFLTLENWGPTVIV